MAIVQGGATGGATKSTAVDNYWKNYSKYNTPTTKKTTPTAVKKTTPAIKKTTSTIAPTAQATTKSTTPIVATSTDRDIGTEIAAELAKDTVDWNKLSGLTSERNSKITANNMTGVESTEDMINRLYRQQEKNSTPTETETNTAEVLPGTPKIVATAKIEPEVKSEVDAQEYIDRLLAAKRESQLAALEKSKNNALENLDNEAAGIEPAYYNKRNEVGAQSDVGALNFAQYMAGRGIKGNAGAMPEIYRNSALQGNIGKLNQQEQAARDTIARNRTGVQNAYESDYAAAGADIDAQGLQAYINQMNADRAYNQQQQQYDDTQFAQQKQDYVDTINRFSDNYQAEIDNITNDNDTTNDWQIPYLQSARQQKLQTQAEQTAAAAAAASETERQQYLDALNEWELAGEASARVAEILGVEVGDRTADYDIDKINAATSQQNANTAAKNANTAATKTDSKQNVDNYVNYITANFGNDKTRISAYLETLMAAGVDDATVNALAEKYGL